MRNDFAIFMISHGRADSVLTVKSLERAGYNGKWYIVIDNEDDQEELYKKNFGAEHIIVFDKAKSAENFDIMDNFTGRQVPTFARNVLFQLAKDLGLTYFLHLEDDYENFRQRFLKDDGTLGTRYVRDFDSVIDAMLEFLDVSGAKTVAFAQSGDLIGGKTSKVFINKLNRKAMNCFFCRTDRPFTFLGRFNDDVNAYIEFGKRGDLFFTIRDIIMDQPPTQTRSGGITDAYKFYGTYVKSFYSVMLCPSFVRISDMGHICPRIHHTIIQDKAYPKIISSDFKKR